MRIELEENSGQTHQEPSGNLYKWSQYVRGVGADKSYRPLVNTLHI